MLGTENLPLFIASGLLLNIAPGQDNLYIVGRSVSQGRRAGVTAVAGIVSGCVVHVCAAAVGLSAILATSARAFTIVKLAGGGYLLYLGAHMLIERQRVAGAPELARDGALKRDGALAIYRGGFFSNLLNPKTALFFLAFLPQFVSSGAPSRALAFLFLGGVFIFNGTLWCLALVWAASAVSRRLRERPSSGVLLKRATGAVFMGLGLKLAVSR
jgi:threonine/homoserine/homoserine lactone efflux protein